MQILFDRVTQFLETPSILPKVIIIYGPTACGKTTLSIELAKHLNTEIIGADSRQIYRYLNIGTGKVTEPEKQGVPHHMIDIIDPNQEYSVGAYQKAVLPIIDKLHEEKKIPILCGGTGLYLDAVAFHFDIPASLPDWEYRDELEKLRLEKGNEYLWDLLNAIDPEYASELHYNNHRYVARALEVIRKTGTSKKLMKTKKELLYDILFLTPYDGDRANLYEGINARIEGMYEQ